MKRIDIETAIAYHSAGLSCLPADKGKKRPSIGSWKKWSKHLPTQIEVEAWFANKYNAICVVTGEVSQNLECIDFDCQGVLYEAWKAKVDAAVLEQCAIERSQSGGIHVFYRCEGKVGGNTKLASRKINKETKTFIETRGEGGLALCAHSEGYELLHGSLTSLPVLSEAARNAFLCAARELDEKTSDVAPKPSTSGVPAASGLRPGDDFNARGDIRPYLKAAGWALSSDQPSDGKNENWTRPGKDPGAGGSASFDGTVFYVFSSNASPFAPAIGYNKFQVYTYLEHGGDYSSAAKSLSALGYGNADDPLLGVDFSNFHPKLSDLGEESAPLATAVPVATPLRWTIDSLVTEFSELRKPIIHGFLREGEIMNLIAPPKLGKSWLVGTLAIAVAQGTDWLGYPCEKNRVLIVDNELHPETTASRYRALLESLGVDPKKIGQFLTIESQRGRLKSVADLLFHQKEYAALQPKLLIVDAFYRALPEGTEENDNAAITQLYNKLDQLAAAIGCAIILVHHTSKGNQANKTVTDVGAGAGAISRAADTHVILRRHKQNGCAVVESVVRSWPSINKFCIRYRHPLWTRDGTLGTEDVEGVNLKKSDKTDLPESTIIDALVKLVDPDNPHSKTSFIDIATNRILGGKARKSAIRTAFETAINKGYLRCLRSDKPEVGKQAAKFVYLGDRNPQDDMDDDSEEDDAI